MVSKEGTEKGADQDIDKAEMATKNIDVVR